MQKQPFPVRGEGVKSLRTGGVKKFQDWWEGYLLLGGGGSVPHYMPCSSKKDARDGYSVNTEIHLKICQTSMRKFFQFMKIFNLLQTFDTSCSLLYIKFIASVKKSSHQMQPVLFTLANLICQGWVGEICLKTQKGREVFLNQTLIKSKHGDLKWVLKMDFTPSPTIRHKTVHISTKVSLKI